MDTATQRILHRQQAFSCYCQQKFGDAISHFEQQLKAHPEDERSRFYFGLALIRAGQPHKAVVEFNKILEWRKHLGNPVKWYLSLALIGAGRPQEAIIYLDKFIEEESVFSKKARHVLGNLRKRKGAEVNLALLRG